MAFALFCWWTAEYLFGVQTVYVDSLQKSILAATVLVPAVGLWFLLTAKKERMGEDANYGALAISGGISIVASSIFILALTIIFYKLINPGWADFMTEKSLDLHRDQKTPEEIEAMREGFMAVFAPGSMGMQNFSRFIMFGMVVLLIEALVVLKLPSKK